MFSVLFKATRCLVLRVLNNSFHVPRLQIMWIKDDAVYLKAPLKWWVVCLGCSWGLSTWLESPERWAAAFSCSQGGVGSAAAVIGWVETRCTCLLSLQRCVTGQLCPCWAKCLRFNSHSLLLIGCFGSWLLWQNSSPYSHHGLHFFKPGYDHRYVGWRNKLCFATELSNSSIPRLAYAA